MVQAKFLWISLFSFMSDLPLLKYTLKAIAVTTIYICVQVQATGVIGLFILVDNKSNTATHEI